MYREHFQLDEAPFSITPDPRFVFLSDRHRDALAHLVYGIGQGGGGGFVQLTGEVGTGKTTLSRLLLAQLPPDTRIALVLNPRLTSLELLETIAEELGVDIAAARGSGKALVDVLNRYLLDAHGQGLRVVLILDEAQQLSVDTLEQVRLLTNLETETQKLLQIVLLGQPELKQLLERDDLRQLAQRITARYHLTPLDADETAAYVRHRLTVAGRKHPLFTERALGLLHRRSGGVPRLINVIAERSLLAGYARDAERIDTDLVTLAADELLPPSTRKPVHRRATAAAVLAVLTALIVTGWRYWRPADPIRLAPVIATQAVPAAEATPTSPANTTFDLDTLLTSSGDGSQAAAALLAAWRAGPELAARMPDCPFHLVESLYCTRGQGDLAQLAELNRPALLIVPHQGEHRAIALLGLDGDHAVLDIGSGPQPVSRSELATTWPGDYVALSRLPETVDAIHASELPPWALTALTRFEMNRSLPPLSEASMRILRLQRHLRLRADGIIGPETWWALSAWLDDGPRLRDDDAR